jgi:two-component system, response regulator PdtaR
MTSAPTVPGLQAGHEDSTILVVEDQIITRVAVAEELRDHGYKVIEAGTADEALGILRAAIPVDVVLTDLEMPGSLNGSGLVRLIRAEFNWLKVVMFSGLPPEEDVRRLLDGYLAKPILPWELVRYLRTFIPSPAMRRGRDE